MQLSRIAGGLMTFALVGMVQLTTAQPVEEKDKAPKAKLVTRQVIPSLTWWESEWVFLRAQYRYEKVPFANASHQLAVQAVWAIGPHKHEIY